MIEAAKTLHSLTKSLPAALTVILIAAAALPARAQSDGEFGFRSWVPEPATIDVPQGSNLLLAHKVRLGVPPALTGDDDAQAPKFNLELGYGRSLPPALGSAPHTNLPKEFSGRADQSAIKANVTLGF